MKMEIKEIFDSKHPIKKSFNRCLLNSGSAMNVLTFMKLTSRYYGNDISINFATLLEVDPRNNYSQ